MGAPLRLAAVHWRPAFSSSSLLLSPSLTPVAPRICCDRSRRRTPLSPQPVSQSRRWFSEDTISRESSRVQVYISRSSDPYLNLSIEHFLLQKSHPDSVILLLYTNKPCVVIGRNQNPWVEVNLGLLKGSKSILQRYYSPPDDGDGGDAATRGSPDETSRNSEQPAKEEEQEDVQLVRRRSGGGTVFHDAGNLNWSVICPPAIFDRDKHAEMVVRALRGLTLGRHPELNVRVNERHDIVMDISNGQPSSALSSSSSSTYKISGSAYKLTRLRSLHHGTLLLSSPNLSVIGQFLRSPAEPYIKARGVESVRSPIHNVGLSNNPGSAFERAVVAEFGKMYRDWNRADTSRHEDKARTFSSTSFSYSSPPSSPTSSSTTTTTTTTSLPPVPEILNPEAAQDLLTTIPAIRKGYDELRSGDWIFTQTPQFTFSTYPTEEDPRPRPELRDVQNHNDSEMLSKSFEARMSVRHGEITQAEITINPISGGDNNGGNSTESSSPSSTPDSATGDDNSSALVGAKLHEIRDWRTVLGKENKAIGTWLNKLFGVTPPPPSS